jgi:membrane protease YdiL (CAAX protease family)
MAQYLRFTRSAYYGVVVALPLLVTYEALLMLGGGGLAGQVRNAGDVWLRMLLASLEIRPAHATLVMILVLLLALPVVKRQEVWLRGSYLGLLALEALGYSLALGLLINIILEFIFSAIPSAILSRSALPMVLPMALPAAAGPLQGLALSLGAGLFEEFFFRVLVLGGLLLVTRAALPGHAAAIVSILGASLLFAAAHYVGPLADPISFGSFMFRFIAGMLFTGLYYLRGFGVTALCHAFYDIRVILF